MVRRHHHSLRSEYYRFCQEQRIINFLKNYEELKAANKKLKETLCEKDMKHAQEMVLDKQLSETLK